MRNRFVLGLAVLCLFAFGAGHLPAQTPTPGPEENPTGNTGALKAQIETGGSYDAHSANGTRMVTDLSVPCALGDYGLDFTRYWNSLPADYADPNAEWPQDFGMSGWSHSWRWHAELITYSEPVGDDGGEELYHTQIIITFPDGHTTKYKIVRSNRPHGIPPDVAPPDIRLGPDYTQPEITSGWPDGGLGVHDHIYQMAVNGSSFWLARADGGSVRFIWVPPTPQGAQGYYLATEVIDPHGLKTDLIYTGGLLTEVRQEGGRSLKITWSSFTNSGPVITRVESGDSAGAQYVTYSYKHLAPQYNYFLVLAKVGYPNDQAPGQSSSAIYTYWFDYAPGVAAQSAAPLLKYADDPRYAGAMTKIRYEYAYDNGGDASRLSSRHGSIPIFSRASPRASPRN